MKRKMNPEAFAKFEKQITVLLNRMNLLRSVARGEVELRKIKCVRKQMTWTVNARSETYYRYIAPARPKKVATRSKKVA